METINSNIDRPIKYNPSSPKTSDGKIGHGFADVKPGKTPPKPHDAQPIPVKIGK